jgi:hypothetical protein
MSARDASFTVLVNSSDGFDDCWVPFFTLLRRYWPECAAPILLNTERKAYEHKGLDITCTMVQLSAATRLSWSECLLAALARIKTPLVLYFQEDYFLHSPVLDARIGQAASYMLSRPNVAYIGLTRLGGQAPYEPHSEDWLQAIRRRARYRISTQAALWRVETLKSYLRPEENGWMFEIFGTWRAWRRNDYFLCARFDAEHGGPAIDYPFTGIIKGRWLPEIQGVFERHGIVMDYSRRGFYRPKHPVLRRLETAQRLLANPRYLIKQLL